MPKNSSLATGLTVLFVVLMLASLLARFWAVDLAWKKTGPTHLAATTDQVFLFAAGELFQLSADGELLQRFPSSITGLDDDPIDLRIMNDGRLLIAEQQPARIRLCNTGTWACDEIGASMYPHLHRQFKVLPATPHHELLITDAAGDMLWGISQDQSGPNRNPKPLVPARTLASPNDLAMDRNGNLWIADTDHRRIIELKFLENGEVELGREHSAQNHLTVGERYFPMMLAEAPDGLWWVVQPAEFSEGTADLVVYHPDEGANTRVELPGSTYPTDIAASGAFMLVTDLEQFRVYRIDTRHYDVSDFGDERFKLLMSGLKERKDRYLRISTLALAGVILFGGLMIAMAFKATPRSKRWTQAPSAIDFSKSGQSTPEVRGIHWLVRDARVDRSLKWAERLAFILPVGLMVSMLAGYGVALSMAGASPDDQVQEKLNDMGIVLILGAFVMLCLIPVIRLSIRPLKAQLGSDGRRLCVRLFDGSEFAVPPSELAYTHRAILHRQFTVPLQTGLNQKLYADGELEDWVLPLLREAEEISPAQAVKRMWQQRDDLLLWSVIAGVAMGLALILMSMVTN